MSSNIKIRGGSLYENDRLFLSTDNEIQQFLTIDTFLIILFKPNKIISDRNIFGYNIKGIELWQIAQPSRYSDVNHYTFISCKDGVLIAININGVEVVVNPETGVILRRTLIK